MILRPLLLIVSCLLFTISYSQDFKSFTEIRQILLIDLVSLDDSLAKKGFVYEKTEGLVLRYKKNTSRIEFQITPKQITYIFSDRSFFLKANSELVAGGYQLVNGEENITVQNKPVKAAYLKKESDKVYLWSFIDEPGKKTMYAVRIQQDPVEQNTTPKAEPTAPKKETPPPVTPQSIWDKVKKQKDTAIVHRDSSRVYPKPHRLSLTLAVFNFVDPDYFSVPCPSFQLGYQKSSFAKKERSRFLSDIGYEIEASVFTGMDYGWRTVVGSTTSPFEEYIDLKKYYLACNQYRAYNLKFVEFALEGGVFLNYTYGKGKEGSAGFMSTGLHFGEHLQRGFGKTTNGHAKRYIGIGFDQYIAIKGGYIGSFGINIGF